MGLDPLRDVRIREAMRAHDLDALICRLPENVLLLTGYWPLSGFAFVFYPREGPVSLVAVTTEMASVPDGVVDDVRSFDWGVLGADDPYVSVRRHLTEVIRAARLQRARIGYEGSFEAVAPGHMAGETMAPAGVTHAMIACAAPDARLVDATPALYRARARPRPRSPSYGAPMTSRRWAWRRFAPITSRDGRKRRWRPTSKQPS